MAIIEKCPYCKKEYDLMSVKTKYCIECEKCKRTECQEYPYSVRGYEFYDKKKKKAFLKCKSCGERIYTVYALYSCPHCKKEIKYKSEIFFISPYPRRLFIDGKFNKADNIEKN